MCCHANTDSATRALIPGWSSTSTVTEETAVISRAKSAGVCGGYLLTVWTASNKTTTFTSCKVS